MWAGIYSMSECTLTTLRNTDDAYNKILSGAITGGVLALRAGPRIAMKNGLIGGIILGSIVLFELIMVKQQKRMELE
jgi:import inner membrane translocase subunit TIM17